MNTQHLKLSEVTRVDPTSPGALRLCEQQGRETLSEVTHTTICLKM